MMTTSRQLDLFDPPGMTEAAPERLSWGAIDPGSLSDAALIAVIPRLTQHEAWPVAREVGQRGLVAAVPVLEALCRRFKGFGADYEITEQTASLSALTVLGGRDAVTRLIEADAIQGPGARHAIEAAAALGCALPAPRLLAFLRHDDPAVRAASCRCARNGAAVIVALIDLLADLHPAVSFQAAMALCRMGRREGAAIVSRALAAAPSAEIVVALAAVADEDDVVRLGQTALSRPELAEVVLAALDDLETPRAMAVAAGIRRRSSL